MDFAGTVASLTLSVIILVLTISTFVFTVILYSNLLKYRQAALGLIFTRLNDSVTVFKLIAVAVLIFAVGRLIDLFNIISFSHTIDNLATVLYLITDLLLIISFYKLVKITKVNKAEKLSDK